MSTILENVVVNLDHERFLYGNLIHNEPHVGFGKDIRFEVLPDAALPNYLGLGMELGIHWLFFLPPQTSILAPMTGFYMMELKACAY